MEKSSGFASRYQAWHESNLGQITERLEQNLLLELAGLAVTAVRGTVFYPPWTWSAYPMAPFDATLGHLTTVGAAYIAMSARKPSDER